MVGVPHRPLLSSQTTLFLYLTLLHQFFPSDMLGLWRTSVNFEAHLSTLEHIRQFLSIRQLWSVQAPGIIQVVGPSRLRQS